MSGEAWDQNQDLRYTLALHWSNCLLLFPRSGVKLLTPWLECSLDSLLTRPPIH